MIYDNEDHEDHHIYEDCHDYDEDHHIFEDRDEDDEDHHIFEDRDDENLFYGECEMAESAVAEVETSRGGVESAIK